MIKKIIKKILYGYKSTSEDYISHLRTLGVKIGENCHIFTPKTVSIDCLNPHLLTIGNNVKITGPTTILTHDYSTCVLNQVDNVIYGKQKKTIIGNNVFLGWGCTVLAGTEIGDNTIIGAGTVISGKIPGNYVYAGNPAKKICSIDEYRKKIQSNQISDAKQLYLAYKDRYNEKPTQELFHEYFFLFSDDENILPDIFKNKLKEENISFCNKNAYFKNYEDFCEFCEDESIHNEE